MYTSPKDLAQAALRFLEEAKTMTAPTQRQIFVDHILAANLFANQVYDWHVRQYGKKTHRGEDTLDAFKRHYPEHETINSIANGTKHPFPVHPDISKGQVRKLEWEDLEFWYGYDGRDAETLFVTDNAGWERSVAVLVRTFCEQYVRDAEARIHSEW